MNDIQKNAYKERIERLKKENKDLLGKLELIRKDNRSIHNELKKTRNLLSKIPCSVILVQNRKIVFANEMTWKQLGYPRDELFGQELLHLVHSISSDYAKDILDRYSLGKPIPEQFEIYLRKKNGEPLCCDVHLAKIRYDGRAAVLYNLTGLDRRKLEEKKLRQSQKIRTVAMMASGLNRDVNKVLNSLNEHFSFVQEMSSIKDKAMLRSLKKIKSGAVIVDRISQHLRCLTKNENDPSEIVLFDPKDVVQKAVAVSIARWKDHHEDPVDVKTYLRTFSPVKGNQNEIQDVFVYMILNAFEAMPEGGQVYLTTEENSGFAWTYIQDSGTGISDELKDFVFDPFFTTKGSRHAGLGLSLAHAVVRRHGGEIEVLSQKGQGSTFIVKLPFSPQDAAQTHVKQIKNRIRDMRILIISGGSVMMELLMQELVSKGGKVTEVYACMEGLKLLKRKKFELAVVDGEIPDLESAGFVQNLKRNNKGLPFILVNAGNKENATQLLGQLRADLIIERPLDMDRISSIISSIINESEASR